MRPSLILLAGLAGVFATAGILTNARDRGRGAGLEALRISAGSDGANHPNVVQDQARERTGAANGTISIRISVPNRRPIAIECPDRGAPQDCADRVAEVLSPTALAEAEPRE